MMTELEFKSLASQGYNRIPLIAEAFADLRRRCRSTSNSSVVPRMASCWKAWWVASDLAATPSSVFLPAPFCAPKAGWWRW